MADLSKSPGVVRMKSARKPKRKRYGELEEARPMDEDGFESDEECDVPDLTSGKCTTKRLVKFLVKAVVIAVVVVVIVLGFLLVPSFKNGFLVFVEWVQSLGWIGVYVFTIAHIPYLVFLGPPSWMWIASGFLFHVAIGFPVSWMGSVMGCGCAFLVGRFVARRHVEKWVFRKWYFKALDKAATDNGFKVTFLLRLTPIPSVMKNYGLAVTGVTFWHYNLATVLGLVPTIFIHTYIGSTLRSAAEVVSSDGLSFDFISIFMLALGLVGTLLSMVIISMVGLKYIKDAMREIKGDRRQDIDDITQSPFTIGDSEDDLDFDEDELAEMEMEAVHNDLPPESRPTVGPSAETEDEEGGDQGEGKHLVISVAQPDEAGTPKRRVSLTPRTSLTDEPLLTDCAETGHGGDHGGDNGRERLGAVELLMRDEESPP